MDELGGYRPLTSPGRELGSAIFLSTLCLAALLERLQFQLRASEASVWWASNGRDVVNAFAVAVMSLGLTGIGFTGPIAVCIAATLVILLSALQGPLGSGRVSAVIYLGATLGLGVAAMVFPEAIHDLFRRVLELLFD